MFSRCLQGVVKVFGRLMAGYGRCVEDFFDPKLSIAKIPKFLTPIYLTQFFWDNSFYDH